MVPVFTGLPNVRNPDRKIYSPTKAIFATPEVLELGVNSISYLGTVS